ncbi:uncharacterized protein LOC119612953, partial [Lucilia sericata]|uniref:uncharacterized protein LOC119612953 n=1 Tax=Lucilia sericata TaxID=13632 RepID=UPI0018A86742
MDLRPLTYEEMCQMELMHTGSNCGGIGGISVVGGGAGGTSTNPSASISVTNQTTMAAVPTSASQNSNTSTTTMLPIMVIPTSMMPPGTHLITTTTAAAAANAATPLSETEYDNDTQQQQQQQLSINAAQPTHFYQLQPTHILATATPSNTEFTLTSTPTATLLLQPTAQLTGTEQLPHSHQLLQQQPQQIPQQTVNILYTGTLTKNPQHLHHHQQQHNTATPLTRSALECSTLPRNFQAKSLNPPLNASQDESDFEGSECGASVSTTTCIPHFRFGGCGVILQPATQNFNQQQQPPHHGEPQVIGCASLSHMMGSFASAAGDAMHTGSRNLAGTLGRNRRTQQQQQQHHQQQQDGITTQTPKRVSFKGVDLPPPPTPEELQMLDAGHGPTMDTFNNCSYMNFDNFMDYQ